MHLLTRPSYSGPDHLSTQNSAKCPKTNSSAGGGGVGGTMSAAFDFESFSTAGASTVTSNSRASGWLGS